VRRKSGSFIAVRTSAPPLRQRPWAGVCGAATAPGNDGDAGEGADIVAAGGTLTTRSTPPITGLRVPVTRQVGNGVVGAQSSQKLS
jgi:hypothetical protein